jgi:hypothetical protein
VPSAPSLGVTGPPSTSTISQVVGTQTTCAHASESQPLVVRSMDETKENKGASPREVTLGKRKPRWFQETLKESKELIGEPQRLMRERKPPEVLFVLGHGDEHHIF